MQNFRRQLSLKKDLHLRVFFILVTLVLSLTASASFYEQEIKPVVQKAGDSKSQQLWGMGLAFFFVVRTQDDSWRNAWRDNQKMAAVESHYGDRLIEESWQVGVAVLQTLVDTENGKRHLKALAFTGLNTIAFKGLAGRERPNQANHLSFPSGHTSSAFASATALSYAYGWKAAVLAYPLAIGVGLSRTADDDHWLSDVVAGAWLGVIWGRAAFANQELEAVAIEATAVEPRWMVAPWMSGQVRGLQIVYSGF